ncbi:hypothetical protein [Enterovirga rhinocerotis]|uniref:PXPV repeat-containing protein n=1 Tax=Enterovirga rhinocerotis TaxID=1339210 RepID=A0A4R7C9U1_9HYPH|nr:hypothetical protein [Enterovirga rhinocerotis]TDR94822.1 hypothetical protein EV668_2111 [Enterovirga rhinocerotis]
MLKRLILTLALLIGAFVVTQGPSQAAPLGASAQAQSTAPANVEKAQYYYYRRRYRPRYYGYRRYYRPRAYYYRPPVYRRYYYRPRYYW